MVSSVATPANWRPGQQCMVQPTLTDARANQELGGFSKLPVPSGKPYMRLTVSCFRPDTLQHSLQFLAILYLLCDWSETATAKSPQMEHAGMHMQDA